MQDISIVDLKIVGVIRAMLVTEDAAVCGAVARDQRVDSYFINVVITIAKIEIKTGNDALSSSST